MLRFCESEFTRSSLIYFSSFFFTLDRKSSEGQGKWVGMHSQNG